MVKNFVMFRKATGRLLRIDEIPVDGDFKDTSRALDEIRDDTKFLLDRGGQTVRLRFVVSHYAVFNRQLRM